VPDNEIVEVSIDKGMKSGQKITIYGKGEQAPGVQPGDLIIVVEEVRDPEERFVRDGKDLHYPHSLTLSEALTGYEFTITHMDGRVLVVRSQPGEIVKPGDVRVIEGEGMPQYKSPFDKGRLFVKLDIAFPTPQQLTPDVLKKIEVLLPPKPRLGALPEEAEDVRALPYDPMDSHENGHSMHDDDDEEQGGNQARCVHQ